MFKLIAIILAWVLFGWELALILFLWDVELKFSFS